MTSLGTQCRTMRHRSAAGATPRQLMRTPLRRLHARPCCATQGDERLPSDGSGSESSGSGGSSDANNSSSGRGSWFGGTGGSDEADGEQAEQEQTPTRYAAGSVVYRAKTGAVTRAPSFPLTVPLLPFPSSEVLCPGGTKVLHLYESRYLAMLEQVLKSEDRVFAHIVVEQPRDPGTDSIARLPGALVGEDFALGLTTLVQVMEVKAQGVGALVRVQGEGRCTLQSLQQVQPYLMGTVTPLLDDPVQAASVDAVMTAAEGLADVLRACSDLCARFGGTEAATLQQAILFCDRTPLMPGQPAADGQQALSASLERAHRIAWAALSALPQASESELRQLQRCRLAAMAGSSTLDRLQLATTYLESARAMLVARISLKSLNLGAS